MRLLRFLMVVIRQNLVLIKENGSKDFMFAQIIKKTLSVVIISLNLLIFTSLALANDNDTGYQTALTLAREGKLQKSISIFQDILARQPDNLRYHYDYILILNWAGKNDEVLAESQKIALAKAPVYVLEAVARAARNKKQFKKSEKLYRLAIQKIPDRIQSKVGLALVLTDQGRTSEALKILVPMKQKHPQNIDVFSALAYAYETDKRWFMALAAYERILSIDPHNKYAQRNRIFILDKVGASSTAMAEAKKFAPLFSKQEMAKIRWNRAAFLVRAGKIGKNDGSPRFKEMDEAIKHIEENIEFAKSMPEPASKTWLTRAKFDLIVALHGRYRMQEVVDLYQQLKQQKVNFPAYVLFPVADALLYLQKPDDAVNLYQAALKQTEGQKITDQIFYAKISLYFALLEAERNDQATAWVEKLAAVEPVKIKLRREGKKPARKKDNSRKLTVEMLLAMDRAYNDNLQEAQIRLEKLLNNAPYNQDIRNSLANVYYWRGWPRKAEKLYQLAKAQEPDNTEIQISHIQNLVDLREYQQVESDLNRLNKKHSYHLELQRQSRLWNIHNSWEFNFEVNGSRSSGSQEGSRDLGFESYLYAPPVAYNYRPFIHYKWGQGLFPEGHGSAHREGLGVEYSIPDWLITAELHHNFFARNNRFGGRIAAEYAYDDYLSFFASFDSLSAETPLRALSSNIDAKSVNGGLSYRISEARQFRLNAGYMAFSDDNDRYSVSGSYYERWFSSARYKLATNIEVYHSGNSSNQGPYYSPTRDLSFGVTFDNQYLTYRHYDFTMYQNLKFNVGGYWQERFNTGVVGSILYEHQWSAWNQINLAYGITGFSRLYDAVRENGWEAYLRLNWRF